jgi:ribonucleoside-diphosphate reductase beta chain
MQFYARFQDEVVADPAAIGAHVTRAREALSSPFRRIFDEALVQAHERLRLDPRDRVAKVDFVTIYHMVIEGTLGLVTSHFLLDAVRDRGILPGFAEGYSLIAADEQRHIAYGTWFLREAIATDPELAEVVQSRLVDLLPAVAEAVRPPGDGAFDALGLEAAELAAFGVTALNRRLTLIGVSLGESAEQPATG